MTTLTITNPKIAETIENDPYELGWRYALRPLPNGDYFSERVPLTLEDILHPQIGDFRLHNQSHELFCLYLHNVFTACVEQDPTATVLHDVRVAWAASGVDPHGPDIAVIFGVKEHRDWKTFDEEIEGTKPTLVAEITSPKTRQVDLLDKFDEYAQAGVPFYIIVDNYELKGKPIRRLLGYQLSGVGYVAIQPNEQGQLWLPPLKIWLGMDNDEPHCYDEDGTPIGNYLQIRADLAEAKTQLAAAARARTEAENRAQEAETQLTAADRARTEAENRAQEAETKMREMEAELRRLQGETDA